MHIVNGATWWLQIYRIVRNTHKSATFGGRNVLVRSVEGRGMSELIPTMKMESGHPVEIQFGREFPAICYHCRILAAWNRQNWNIFETFLRFLDKRPLMIEVSKFCSESLHRDTDRRCCVQNSWKLSDGKSVKACVIYLTKKTNIFSAPSKLWLVRGSRTKSAMASPQHLGDNFQISSKSVHIRRTYSRPREDRSKCTIESH